MARTKASEKAKQAGVKKRGLCTRSVNSDTGDQAGPSTPEPKKTRSRVQAERLTYELHTRPLRSAAALYVM